MGDPEVGIRHVACRLFMPHRNGFNLVLPVIDRVQ
jgi:hypothetical protein